MAKSILQTECECYVCKTTQNLELHHVMYGSGFRPLSDKFGLTVYLCHEHHTGDTGVHFNRELNNELREKAQRAFEEKYNHNGWMAVFGRNYLNEEDWK